MTEQPPQFVTLDLTDEDRHAILINALQDYANAALDKQGNSMAEISALTEKQSAERTQLNLQIESLVTQPAAARNDAGQVDTVQKDLAAAHGEIARLQEQLNASERKNSERVALLEKDNEALNARLKQAQSTLDQIAATNRSITVPGAISTPAAAPASTSQNSVTG